jgi:membrane protease YdiL (CAAX protease family)
VIQSRWLRDPHFYVALFAGPAVWALLWLFARGPGLSVTPLLVFNMVLLYPLLEELAFRGFVQGWLSEQAWFQSQWFGFSRANLTTSVLFAMAHLINQPPLWAASVFFPSLVFGYFKDRHQTVVTPFLLHAWYNAGFLVVMAAG